VGPIAPLLATEIDFLIPPVGRRRFLVVVFGFEALQARPSLDQCSIDRKMIVGQKAFDLRLR